MKLWTWEDIEVLHRMVGWYVPTPQSVPVGDLYTDGTNYWLRIEDERCGSDLIRWEKVGRHRAHEMLDDAFVRETYGIVS